MSLLNVFNKQARVDILWNGLFSKSPPERMGLLETFIKKGQRIELLLNTLFTQLVLNKRNGYSKENMFNLARDYGCLRAHLASLMPNETVPETMSGVAVSPEAYAYYGLHTEINPWEFWKNHTYYNDNSKDDINSIIKDYREGCPIYDDRAKFKRLIQDIENECNADFQAIQKRKKQEQETWEVKLKLLDSQLVILNNKIAELKARKWDKAAEAASKLHDTLFQLRQKYSFRPMEYIAFKKESIIAITLAQKTLTEHRGLKEIIGNIVLCILGLGIGYLIICACKNSFFKFNTDSSNKLNELRGSIENIERTERVI